MKTPSVLVVDYGMGNIFSIEMAVRHFGGDPVVSDDPSMIAGADRVILPGVGAFGKAMLELGKRGLIEELAGFARKERPMLGICLGMQLLMGEGLEFGRHEGLALLDGTVRRLEAGGPDGAPLKVPHIGWAGVWPSDGE